MGLKNMLTTQGSPLSKANGGNIPTPVGATDQSKLQYTYSINGAPHIPNKPQPSQLDLNGQTPSNQYKNTAPPEGIGRI
tara:strand:+ start:1238 stop:1474 length:237 start_codon:yes stop_codon:yes gene_type:complete